MAYKNKKASYKFFQNKECEFFPCHKLDNLAEFNCLFCFCPLYALGDRCGGNFLYSNDNIKDCSACLVPHIGGGYDHVMSKMDEIIKLGSKS